MTSVIVTLKLVTAVSPTVIHVPEYGNPVELSAWQEFALKTNGRILEFCAAQGVELQLVTSSSAVQGA